MNQSLEPSPEQIEANCNTLELKLAEADQFVDKLENSITGLTPERNSHNRALSQLLQESATLAHGLLEVTAGTYHPRVQALAQRFARDYSYTDNDIDHLPAIRASARAHEMRTA